MSVGLNWEKANRRSERLPGYIDRSPSHAIGKHRTTAEIARELEAIQIPCSTCNTKFTPVETWYTRCSRCYNNNVL